MGLERGALRRRPRHPRAGGARGSRWRPPTPPRRRRRSGGAGRRRRARPLRGRSGARPVAAAASGAASHGPAPQAGRGGARSQPLQRQLRERRRTRTTLPDTGTSTPSATARWASRPCSTTRTTSGGAKSPERSHVHVAVAAGDAPPRRARRRAAPGRRRHRRRRCTARRRHRPRRASSERRGAAGRGRAPGRAADIARSPARRSSPSMWHGPAGSAHPSSSGTTDPGPGQHRHPFAAGPRPRRRRWVSVSPQRGPTPAGEAPRRAGARRAR